LENQLAEINARSYSRRDSADYKPTGPPYSNVYSQPSANTFKEVEYPYPRTKAGSNQPHCSESLRTIIEGAVWRLKDRRGSLRPITNQMIEFGHVSHSSPIGVIWEPDSLLGKINEIKEKALSPIDKLDSKLGARSDPEVHEQEVVAFKELFDEEKELMPWENRICICVSSPT
jgi:hypothetical protein